MNERIRGNAWKINWYEWNKEAFEKAKNENKLVLLSLAGVWCHWCHVMDETTYSDEEVIKLINENFIPIRVDVDERPDISERYNFGGYPTFAFLTSEGDVITGGTYVQPQQFKEILKEIIEISKKRDIKELLASSVTRKKEIKKTNPNEKIIWDIVDILISYFDESHGGFGIEPKFPLSEALLFLAHMYEVTGKEGFKIMVRRSIEGMINGLFDKIEGGFFRYSVSRDWRTPHYEKMLDTNSNILKVLSYSYYLFKDPQLKDIVEKTSEYLLNNLRDKELGLFYSSQDADEIYYSLSLEERRRREKPYIDRNIYSCKNALCAEAFFYAGICLERKDYIEISKQVLNRLLEDFYSQEDVLHAKHINKSFLDDNIYLLNLLLRFYSYDLDNTLLTKAVELSKKIINGFMDENGLFMDSKRYEDIGLLKESYNPINENSLAMKAFYILGELSNSEELKQVSTTIASIFSSNYQNYSIFASSFADSLLFVLNPIEVRLVFDKKESVKIIEDSKIVLHPQVYLKFVDFSSEKAKAEYNKEGIYVCKGNVCYPPVENSQDLLNLIRKIAKDLLKI